MGMPVGLGLVCRAAALQQAAPVTHIMQQMSSCRLISQLHHIY
jgi:hypothetical protein